MTEIHHLRISELSRSTFLPARLVGFSDNRDVMVDEIFDHPASLSPVSSSRC